MADTPNLALPYIEAAQAQKHVTHNEAIKALDAVVQLAVLDRTLTTPPASPVDGERHIVAAGASGAWTGKSGCVAAFQDGVWVFFTPREGWIAWIGSESLAVVWHGAAWQALTAGSGTLQNVPLLGINATADTTNRLAVSADATLLNNAGHGHQLKLNKASASDTASVLLQDAFSGRAEIGLTGDDNLHVKVSADGAAWKESISIDRTSGVVSFPSGANGLTGPQGPQGPVGPTGATGPAGAQGATGPAAWTAVAAWAAQRAYVVGPPASVVTYSGGTYVCTTAHTSAATFDSTKWVQVAAPGSAGSGGTAVNPNLLINGDFQINNRLFAGGALAAGAYGFDRWKADTGGCSISVSAFLATLSAGTLVQVIEPAVWGYTSFAATTFTVSMENVTGSPTITIGSSSAAMPNGSGRQSVTITTAAGDSGNLSVKILSNGATVTFGRVKVELGTSATGWQPRDLMAELRLCARYYQKSYPRAVAPGANAYAGMIAVVATSASLTTNFNYAVEMRAGPTFTLYSPYTSNTTGKMMNATQSGETATVAPTSPQSIGLAYVYVASGTLTAGATYFFHYTADAEL